MESNNIWNTGTPEFGIEVLGFNKNWIDEDYNIDGTCVCYVQDGSPPYWIISKWCGYHDEWHTRYSQEAIHELGEKFGGHDYIEAPTHWSPKPNNPLSLPPTSLQTVQEKPEEYPWEVEKQNEQLRRKVDFYRSETAKIREYVFDDKNRIGKPCQSIFEAITDKIDALKKENEELKAQSPIAKQEPQESEEAQWAEQAKAFFENFITNCESSTRLDAVQTAYFGNWAKSIMGKDLTKLPSNDHVQGFTISKQQP